MSEPLLNAEDHRIWERWRRVCLLHAQTRGHWQRVQRARDCVHKMHRRCPSAYVSWSAGKDSTAMMHLIAEVIPGVRAMSIKDDCDYPGEVEYVTGLAAEWGVELDIVQPGFSLQEMLRLGPTEAGDDIHSRTSAFSVAGFYSLIEGYRRDKGNHGIYLGLRNEESHGRRMNRAKRGTIYTKRDGETVCMPICDWTDKDVYAYLFAHGIELLHVYRCVRLAESPAKVRKSWWVIGSSARYGQVVWLRTYYPSLYMKLRQIMPGVETMS